MTNCENCTNYIYDDELDYYVCAVNLDEDEMRRFLSGSNDDEYGVVKKQM